MSAPFSNEPPEAVLLDIDGTLLDSNEAHARSWVTVLERHGHPFGDEQVRPLIGKGGDKLLFELVGIADGSDEAEQLSADRRELFRQDLLPTLQPTPGARALLQRFVAEGLRLVVATSAGGDELHDLLRRAGVDDLIDAAASSSDAKASKPDPDIVQAALRKAGLAPGRAVMLGDTPHDIEAAKRAGVRCVALRCGGAWDDASFADAAAIYDDPADLLRHYDESPFAAFASRRDG